MAIEVVRSAGADAGETPIDSTANPEKTLSSVPKLIESAATCARKTTPFAEDPKNVLSSVDTKEKPTCNVVFPQ